MLKTWLGRAFAVTPRTWYETGYMDLDADEYKEDPLKLWTEVSLGLRHREVGTYSEGSCAISLCTTPF